MGGGGRVLCSVGRWVLIEHKVAWAEAYLHTECHLSPSSRLATKDIGRKLGAVPPPLFVWGELGRYLTQCRLGRGLSPCQVVSWSITPFGYNIHGPNIGVPLWGGVETPTSQTDSQTEQTRETGQTKNSIDRTVLQTVAQKCSDESYKWIFISQHVFKVSTTSMHAWPQMVMPWSITVSIMFCSKSNQVCIKRFRRSSMSWIFVSDTHLCKTSEINKFKAHDPWSYAVYCKSDSENSIIIRWFLTKLQTKMSAPLLWPTVRVRYSWWLLHDSVAACCTIFVRCGVVSHQYDTLRCMSDTPPPLQ